MAASDQNLGPLEEEIRQTPRDLGRKLLAAVAQKKADQSPPGCPGCGHQLSRGTRVKMLFVIRFIRIPAWAYLLIWIGLQVLALSMASKIAGMGVAYWAHIGGFVAGMVLSIFVTPRQQPKDF